MEVLEKTPVNEYQQPMSPYERSKVDALKKLKRYIENTDETFSLYKVGIDYGLTSIELVTILKLEMIEKTPTGQHLKFLYAWKTSDPDRYLYKKIDQKAKELHKETSRKSLLKKEKQKRRDLEKKRALREATADRIKKEKLQSIKSQGKILDANDHNLINTLKAGSQGYTKDQIETMASQYKTDQESDSIPIEVKAIKQGNKTTITINISI